MDLPSQQGLECLAKTSKTGLKPHKNQPHFRVQEWAGNTFCYLVTWREGFADTFTTPWSVNRASEFKFETLIPGLSPFRSKAFYIGNQRLEVMAKLSELSQRQLLLAC